MQSYKCVSLGLQFRVYFAVSSIHSSIRTIWQRTSHHIYLSDHFVSQQPDKVYWSLLLKQEMGSGEWGDRVRAYFIFKSFLFSLSYKLVKLLTDIERLFWIAYNSCPITLFDCWIIVNLIVTSPPLSHATKFYIYMSPEDLHGQWFNHFPGQRIPMPHNTFSK